MTGHHSRESGRRGALAAVGAGVLAVVCCAALPLAAAGVGSVALGSVLGVGAGVLTAVALLALVLARAHRRRQA